MIALKPTDKRVHYMRDNVVRLDDPLCLLLIMTSYYEGEFRSSLEKRGRSVIPLSDISVLGTSWDIVFLNNLFVPRERVSSTARLCGACCLVPESFVAVYFIAVNLLHPRQRGSRSGLCVHVTLLGVPYWLRKIYVLSTLFPVFPRVVASSFVLLVACFDFCVLRFRLSCYVS